MEHYYVLIRCLTQKRWRTTPLGRLGYLHHLFCRVAATVKLHVIQFPASHSFQSDKVSGPWSLHTFLCRAVNCTGSGTAAQATKPVLTEREGGSNPDKVVQRIAGDCKFIRSPGSIHWFSSFNTFKKSAIYTDSRVNAFPMNATCFPCTEKITILGNHLTVRMAGRNEPRRQLPAKHQN